jgi:hypothetical protein
VQPEIDDANEIELWDGARIGVPRTFIDSAKRNGNHSRDCKEVWSANRQGVSLARARQSWSGSRTRNSKGGPGLL